MGNFNFALLNAAIKPYDNKGAYEQLQTMMKRGDLLTIKFYVKKDGNIPCAWIESKRTAGFTYQLKTESFSGLMAYLLEGIVTDFDPNPQESDTWNTETDFVLQMMLMLIENGKKLQYVPLFRERPEYITAFFSSLKGKIIFKVKRDDETLGLLREKEQAI